MLVLAAAAGAADAPVVTVTQRLPGLDDVAGGGYEPPDVQVAAGPGFVVELVNVTARFWRTGAGAAHELQTERLSTLFGTGSNRLTDPRIAYDAASGRWLASVSDVDASSIHLAVSATADPTGRWTVSSYGASGCADQPRLGIADGVVVLGADVYRDCEAVGARPVGSELWIVNKDDLLGGSTTPAEATYGPDPHYTSFAPAQSLSSTASEWVVSVDLPFSRVVHLLQVTGVPPDPVRVREVATPTVSLLARPPFAAQPGLGAGKTAPGIETNDVRVLDSFWEDGRLWLSANVACVPPGDAQLRACGRVVELTAPGGAVTFERDLSQAGAHVFFPALRPDANGDLVVVYGESGASVEPETVVVARTADGIFTQPAVVARSSGAYLGDRYGDYFGVAADPGDPATVWVGGEVGPRVAGRRGWATAVASVVVTPVGGTPPLAVVQPPPGLRALAVRARRGTTVRLGYRPLGDGTDVSANITVRARAAGRRLVFARTTGGVELRAGALYSVRWLPARSLRGAFAYCIRAVASDGTTSAPSCATVTLR